MTPKLDSLIAQIKACVSPQDQHLLDTLEKEIAQLVAGDSDQQSNYPSANAPTLNPKTGCYHVAPNPAQYCPKCYDSSQALVTTQRLNSKLRICSQCRASIKPIKPSQTIEN